MKNPTIETKVVLKKTTLARFELASGKRRNVQPTTSGVTCTINVAP